MSEEPAPAPLRRLGLALRGLRLDAGLTGQQLADRAGLSQSTVSRIELGQAMLSLADIDAWGRATGSAAGQLAEVRALAEAAAVESISWRRAERRGLPALQQDVADLEGTAATLLNFQPVIVPGLLQTAEYARRIVLSGYPGGRADIGAAVASRMERQAILYDEARRLDFVIAEAALRWRIGPAPMMLAQLDRIASLATLANVSVGIIPQSAEVTAWHIHGFAILDDRADGGPVVRVETLTTGLSVTGPDDVERYRQAFALLRESAVFGDEAQRLIRSLIAELRQPGENEPSAPLAAVSGY
jgi:transcriptional regulator with XRE-family HTH domain